jgi:hypothetical protein
MARKFVSPGVFTQEVDKSYLAQGVANIGAAVIGLTAKGPAFAPVVVTSKNDFVTKFGDVDTSLMAPYAAMNYLQNSDTMVMVRVLGYRDGNDSLSNGSNTTHTMIINSANVPLAELHFKSGTSFYMTGSAALFSGTIGTSTFTASFDSTSDKYIKKVFNFDPLLTSTKGYFVHKFFEWYGSGSVASSTVVSSASILGANGTASYDYDFTTPVTPYVIDQYGNDLFRLITVSDGDSANYEVKALITNIKKSPNTNVTTYGTFDIDVRSYGTADTDGQSITTFTGLTLDPKSENYLPRRLGNQYFSWNSTTRKTTVVGTFKNTNPWFTVEMATDGWAEDSLPWGHHGYPLQYTSATAVATWPVVSDNLDSQDQVTNTYWGLDSTQLGIKSLLKARAAKSYTGSTLVYASSSAGNDFWMKYLAPATTGTVSYTKYAFNTGSNMPTDVAGSGTTAQNSDGFTLFFYGGFDGWNMTSNPMSGTWSSSTKTAFKLGVDIISNPDQVDINLVAAPGVTDTTVCNYISRMCNDRADCMYIRDIAANTVDGAVTNAAIKALDDNYTAAYYPDLVYSDDNGNQVIVPPSVAVLGAYAQSDAASQVWFAPAGLNRGGLGAFGITDVTDPLTFQDRNDLYDARINPIASFPNNGESLIAVFGQKTLQQKPSALDRVNVRRLLIYAKKTIASTAKYLLFEPNNPKTWESFTNTVNPILEDVRQKQGLERFKVVMDSTVNTPDLIDRNVMTGKIFLQPTKAAEFIDLSFIITATGVAFEE